jgi:hypothetical protein
MSNEQKNGLDSNSGKDFVDAVLMAGVMMMMLMLMMPMITQQISASYSRVQTLAVSPETIAQNVGLMWYEMTALGQPNRLKMVGENSSGAFEEILLALST